MRFSYGKIFLLGFGFFGVSVIWGVYNAFVPIFLANKFGLSAAFIGFFMTLDNIAALLIQPPVGAWSDRVRTRWGRRIPFIIAGAPISAVAFGLIPVAAFRRARCSVMLPGPHQQPDRLDREETHDDRHRRAARRPRRHHHDQPP